MNTYEIEITKTEWTTVKIAAPSKQEALNAANELDFFGLGFFDEECEITLLCETNGEEDNIDYWLVDGILSDSPPIEILDLEDEPIKRTRCTICKKLSETVKSLPDGEGKICPNCYPAAMTEFNKHNTSLFGEW